MSKLLSNRIDPSEPSRGLSKRRMYRPLLSGLLLLLATAVLASDNEVVNGSFEEPAIRGRFSHLDSIPGWDLQEGSKIEIQRNIFGPAADRAQYLELGSNAPSSVGQKIRTTPGVAYELRFSYSPRPGTPDNRFEVLWGADSIANLSPNGQGTSRVSWQEFRGTVRATAQETQITFKDLSSRDAAGAFVDHVRVCRNLVTNDSFEDPAIRSRFSHLDSIPGWDLQEGSKIEIQRNIFGPAPDRDQHLELGSNAPSSVGQKIHTIPGVAYELRFSYSPRPGTADNRFEILWGGDSIANLSPNGQGKAKSSWQEFSGIVRATSQETQLTFRDLSGRDAAGAFIDQVQVFSMRCSKSRAKRSR